MKVGLNVIERGTILSILPKEGNFITLRLIRDLASKVGLSAQEITDFEIVTTENRTTWNMKGAAPTELEFVESEVDIIKKQLKDLNEKQKLTSEMFTLYEKFCQ